MQGIIVAYDSSGKAGVIKGSDNKTYYFTIEEWVHKKPGEDQAVVFEPRLGQAFEVKPVRSNLLANLHICANKLLERVTQTWYTEK